VNTVVTDLDAAVACLAAGAARWANLTVAERAGLIAATHASIGRQAEAWVAAAVLAKRIPAGRLEGEEWLSGPYATMNTCRATAESLRALAAGRSPAAGLPEGTAPGGRTTLQVLPTSRQEWLLFHGFRAEVWLRPGVTAAQARAAAGLGARRPGENGGIALVLGAGNVTSIGPLDVLYQLVAHNRAGILKVNPTFEGLVDVYRAGLAPLIGADVLRVVSGDAAIGGYLAQHPGIDHVHLTGSNATHDAVVWGTGPEAEQRRSAGTPLLNASITSELGGVSPAIVIPGRWSRADLRYQAEQVVTQRLHNAGHSCIATQLLILSSDWPQRTEFLGEIRRVLEALPPRAPWYPGSDRRLAAVDERYPTAELHTGSRLIEISPDAPEDLFDTEYFAPVLGHITLPGTGAEFFRRAVEFANTRVTGNLGASIVVAPADRRAMGAAFEEILAELRYGGIGVNVWSAFAFVWSSTAWGAYPGNTLEAVGSGIGVVHNSYLLADTERTVVRGPFRPFPRSVLHGENALWPKPPWFVTARSAVETNRRMTAYAERPGWGRLLAVLPPAFRA
jgi:acyl-CoA reductase-like NAD-dependent aldehyde dehydrogenase